MVELAAKNSTQTNVFPLMEERRVGFNLAFCAGLMNAWTFFRTQTWRVRKTPWF